MKVNNVDIMKNKRLKNIIIIIIFIFGLVNKNISFATQTWYTMYENGEYSVHVEENYIGLIEALENAGEFESKEMLEAYKTCVKKIKEAGSKKWNNEMYFFNNYSKPRVYEDIITPKIEEAEDYFNSPPTEEEQENKKNAFKKFKKEDYEAPDSQIIEEYWNALKESSKYVSDMNKEDLNLYVKCLNAFRESGAGSIFIENNKKYGEINGILLGISSKYYGKLDKESKEIMEETGNIEEESHYVIFKQPSVSDSSSSTTDSIDGLMSDSEKFLGKGENNKIRDESIQDFSKTMYNILIAIATFVAVLVGGILGVKIMISSADEKAQVKELLIPYVIGCVVVFGAFGIWKLVVTILQNM